MAIIVKGRNTVVSPAVKAYVEKKIDKVTRQFKAVGDITAVLKVENGNHIAEITVPAKGILLRAQESTKDMYSSIDLVIEKIERQVHKYKTKLMKRKYSNFREVPAEAAPAAEPVPAQAEAEEEFRIIGGRRIPDYPQQELHHESHDAGRSNLADESAESRFLRVLRSGFRRGQRGVSA